MTALPTPPRGVVVARPACPEWGEVGEWRHTGQPGAGQFLLRFFAPVSTGPATVTVATGPASHPVAGITDPAELMRCAWMLTAAARWLDAHNTPDDELPADPDPQLSIYDALEVVPS